MIIACLICQIGATTVSAETISDALAHAYEGNPDLNQQRAGTRAIDENVARAKAGFRPQVVGTGALGYNFTKTNVVPGSTFVNTSPGGGLGNTAPGGTLGNTVLGGTAPGSMLVNTVPGGTVPGGTSPSNTLVNTVPGGTALGGTPVNAAPGSTFVNFATGSTFTTAAGLTVSENVFNGNRTTNQVKQAESQVFSAREQTRTTEQNTLQNGATAYMNVLRDTAILELNRNNIIVLSEQLRWTRNRFRFGAVTNTDIAQAEAGLDLGRANYFTARSSLQTSIANYRQIIGVVPRRLEAARPLDALLPATLDEAIAIAIGEHPLVVQASHNADVAQLQIQINEGMLYPTLDAVGSIQQSDQQGGGIRARTTASALVGQVTVPIYTGGDVYALVRQSKEVLDQARLQADLQRDIVRAGVVSAWGLLQAAKATISSARAAVHASEAALSGVRDEAEIGQRTTLDMLIAQQTLLSSRVSLVSAEHDRVVSSYVVLAAIGRLSAENLGLAVVLYDPSIHYTQVKDKWIGLRTPDGR